MHYATMHDGSRGGVASAWRYGLNGVGIAVAGIGMGLRHALDADHVAAVMSLLQRGVSAGRAARVAALWALGHSVSFFLVGVAVIGLGLRAPPRFDLAVDLLVAATLLALGTLALRGVPQDGARTSARPVAVGMVHGLAGSASLALVSSTTLPSRGAAAMYLALFAAGTVLGMVAVTAALSWPLRSALSVSRALPQVAGAVSVVVGVLIAWSALWGGAS
jgi:nickel/cobalt exporter